MEETYRLNRVLCHYKKAILDRYTYNSYSSGNISYNISS